VYFLGVRLGWAGPRESFTKTSSSSIAAREVTPARRGTSKQVDNVQHQTHTGVSAGGGGGGDDDEASPICEPAAGVGVIVDVVVLGQSVVGRSGGRLDVAEQGHLLQVNLVQLGRRSALPRRRVRAVLPTLPRAFARGGFERHRP